MLKESTIVQFSTPPFLLPLHLLLKSVKKKGGGDGGGLIRTKTQRWRDDDDEEPLNLLLSTQFRKTCGIEFIWCKKA